MERELTNENKAPGTTGPKFARADEREKTQKPRGRPFQRGNPGRRPGSRNKVPAALKRAIAADLPCIVERLRERALGGNVAAATTLLRSILPAAKETAERIDFPLPDLATPQAAVEAMARIVAGLSMGDLDPDQAAALTRAVEALIKSIEANDLDVRLRALEAALAKDA